MGTVIVITSGKGGTGKTSLTAGVGSALAALGYSVLCIDMDIGLRNLDISLAMTDTVLMDFTDVITGACPLERAAAPHPSIPTLCLLTAPLSPPREPIHESDLRALLQKAKRRYDYILLDSPAGIDSGFRLAICGADRAIVVATSDPASLRDAQRVATQLTPSMSSRLVVNRVSPRLLRRLGTTIDDAMDSTGLPLLGLVPEDARVTLAANAGKTLLLASRKGAVVAYFNIARRITGQRTPLMKLR